MPKIDVNQLQRVLQFQADLDLFRVELAILFLPRLARYRFEVPINRAQCEIKTHFICLLRWPA
jgi:hypothetical protein